MENEHELVRVNTRISRKVNAWLDDKSKRTGISKSALIHMALEDHIRQIAITDELPKLYDEIKRLKIDTAAKTVR